MNTSSKLQNLRAAMTQHGLAAYIIPSADPHQSEYVDAHWKGRQWISGFSGSAGTAAVLLDQAGLWTDGRYFIQAEHELADSSFTLFKHRMPGVPELIDWLCEQLPPESTVGMDGRLLTTEQAESMNRKFEKQSIHFKVDCDLLEPLWTDRPPATTHPIQLHDAAYSGRTTEENLRTIRELMAEKEANTYLLSSLYDIAWLFNLRGSDIQHCPVVTAYALITAQTAHLFLNEQQLATADRAALKQQGITLHPYHTITEQLQHLPSDRRIYLDKQRTNIFLRKQIPEACTVISGRELTSLPKARKTATQLNHWHTVCELDGVAMVRFLKALEEQMAQHPPTECEAADQLEALRRANPACLDLSFSSISAYGANAAMMHYFPRPETCATLAPNGLYLIDSGGQYQGGTTDITRTWALGPLTEQERTDYTLTLKGLIHLSAVRFMKGATGANLDVLARQPLWEQGIDYKCGTGHGVGFFLNVHEGPQNFSQSMKNDTPLESGMVITIEPGVYREGAHGIRLENMVYATPDGKTEFGSFLRFTPLTLCPIDTAPIDPTLLSPRDIDWLNAYHHSVYEKLAPHLTEEESTWLRQKTAPLPQ